jgi:hypothetical protein
MSVLSSLGLLGGSNPWGFGITALGGLLGLL